MTYSYDRTAASNWLFRWDPKKNVWEKMNRVPPGQEDEWLREWKRDEPKAQFVIAPRAPRKPPQQEAPKVKTEVEIWQEKFEQAVKNFQRTNAAVKRLEKIQGGNWIYFNRKLRDEWERSKDMVSIAANMLHNLGERVELPAGVI